MRIKDRKWEMVDSKVGMKPKFRVLCMDCLVDKLFHYLQDIIYKQDELDIGSIVCDLMDMRERGDFDMFVREVHCTTLTPVSDKAHANNMHYKCNRCDKVKVFGVPIDKEYYDELRKRRGGDRYIPKDEWLEDEDKKRQLEGLGYI